MTFPPELRDVTVSDVGQLQRVPNLRPPVKLHRRLRLQPRGKGAAIS
jgi:hypothetical protein